MLEPGHTHKGGSLGTSTYVVSRSVLRGAWDAGAKSTCHVAGTAGQTNEPQALEVAFS